MDSRERRERRAPVSVTPGAGQTSTAPLQICLPLTGNNTSGRAEKCQPRFVAMTSPPSPEESGSLRMNPFPRILAAISRVEES